MIRNTLSNRWIQLAIGLCLVTGLNISFRHFRHSLPNQSVQKQSTSYDEAEAFDNEFTDFLQQNGYSTSELSSTLFMDSILSIVQSYYVEPKRASTGNLLHGVASVLVEEFPDFRLIEVDGSQSLNMGSSKPITIPSEAGYMDLLKFVFLASKNVDAYLKTHRLANASTEDAENVVLNALLKGLDAHSSILDRESYRELRQGTEGAFGGLGVLVGMRSNLLTVVKPIPNSPAESAGIQRGDRIIAINNQRTFGQNLEDLVGVMRGEPGTSVKMTILRENSNAPIDYELNREVIQVESVKSEIVNRGNAQIAYIAIESFASRTAEEVHQALKETREKMKSRLHGLVLDLRSNPGGLLDQAVQVADLFLKDGVIVSTEGRRNEVERAGKGYHEDDYPIVVLIDGDTASASEIVAGALQDHDRAVVLGQQSFGKGSVQTIFELPGERALKLTVARYYTPLHRSIQGYGIVPDLMLSPIYQKESNVNLLGSGKYRTEGMLWNSLSREDEIARGNVHIKPLYQYSYLLNSTEELDPQAGEMKDDVVRDLAEKLITQVHQTYPAGLPEGGRRSDHWLAVALPVLKPELTKKSEDARQFLRQNFLVDWSEPEKAEVSKPVQIEVARSEIEVSGSPAVASIPVKLRMSPQAKGEVSKLSILFKSRSEPSLETEVLVGRLTSGDSKTIELPLNFRSGFPAGRFAGSLYPVVDGVIQFEAGKKLNFNVNSDEQILNPSLSFIDGANSNVSQVLEVDENGLIQLKLTNRSRRALKNLSVELVNLAGRQITIEEEKRKIIEIAGGETQEFNFKVRGEPGLTRSNIELGLVIGTELSGPLFSSSYVYPSIPASAEAKGSVQSH
jgi:carboxyl-terminal processing protease